MYLRGEIDVSGGILNTGGWRAAIISLSSRLMDNALQTEDKQEYKTY